MCVEVRWRVNSKVVVTKKCAEFKKKNRKKHICSLRLFVTISVLNIHDFVNLKKQYIHLRLTNPTRYVASHPLTSYSNYFCQHLSLQLHCTLFYVLVCLCLFHKHTFPSQSIVSLQTNNECLASTSYITV